jgi:ribosomal protein S18 acetylase RimI-like enzyme
MESTFDNLISVNSKKKKVTRVFSDAFPPNRLGHKDKLPTFSEVHKSLSEIEIDQNKIIYRELNKNDMEEIRLLHKEWFPIDYTDEYFEAIFIPDKRRKNYITLAATYLYENKEYILGAIISEINLKAEFLNQTPQKYLGHINVSIFDQISLFTPEYEFAYIMVIGVVDECRRMKLGTEMLNRLMETFAKRKNCLCVYLHVVKYNETAIKFYQRNNFINTTCLKNFYRIKNEFYDCEVFVRFFTSQEKFEAIEKTRNLFDKVLENAIIKPLKVLIFFITLGLLFKSCRRRHKLD